MKKIFLNLFFGSIISLYTLTPFAMTDDARDWMMRMFSAGQSLNYKGNMVGIRGSNVEQMGIVHKIDADGEQERIYSLNGAPREIIRKSGQLICYLPDKNTGIQGKLFKDQRFFPSFAESDINKLSEFYTFELGEMGRVANRDAQLINIQSKDEFRYGYQLWIDQETGLLLQSACVDQAGTSLEHYMFTEVEINVDIPDSDLEPSELAQVGLNWVQIDQPEQAVSTELACKLENLPMGFELVHSMDKMATDQENKMSQYVFSDGLSSFSLFIEHMYQKEDMKMDGAYQLGVVNVYSRVIEGNRITLMGEIPQTTAKSVAMSVSECH